MKTYSPLFLLAALGVLSPAGTAWAQQVDTSAWKCSACPFPKGTTGTIEAGLGAVSDESARFGDFTGLQRQGAYLALDGNLSHRGDNGFYADLAAANLGLGSRSLSARAGREGVVAVRLDYTEIPRHLSDSSATPFLGNGGAVLSLPAGFPAGTTSAMPLASTLQPIQLGYDRSRLDVGASWNAGTRWSYRVSLRHDVRDGTQRTSGSFYSTAAQLAAPVDQVTDQLEAAASYVGRKLQATLGYQVSLFRNGPESLTWSNPFTPLSPGAVAGQLALAPDNQFHQIFGSAGYAVTPKIRASADFAIGRMTQDAAYLAPTLNTSLPVTLADLPARSLDGRVDTFNGSARVTATLTERLRLNASYSRDVRDNRTSSQAYPVVSTDLVVGSLLRNNLPYDITQDRFKLSADYRGPGSLKASAGAEYDVRERNYQEAVTTRESTVWGRVALQPRDDLSLGLKLAHAERDHSTYGISVWIDSPQNLLLRKYNLAERQRDTAGLRADFTVNDKVSLGIGVDYSNDDYGQSTIGLTDGRSLNLGADLSVAISEKTRLHAFAQGEHVRSRQAGSQTVGAPDWTARTKDRVDLVGVGIKHAVIVDKFDVGADLMVTRSNSDVTVETGASGPLFPTASTSLDSLKLYATYKLQDNLSLTGSFWYEDYQSKDWRLDGVLPATVSNLLVFGEQAPRYRVSAVRLALRYRF